MRGRGERRRAPLTPLGWRTATLGLILAAAVGWISWAAVNLALATVEGHAGTTAIDRARASATSDLSSPRAMAELRLARNHFRAARRRLGPITTLPLRILPVLGRQVGALDGLSADAAHISDIGLGALGEAQASLARLHGTGGERVQVLRRLGAISVATDRQLATVRLTRGHLVWPLAGIRRRYVTRLDRLRDGLRRGATGASAAADLLEGPRRYLVLAANNAEMRAGQGMLLSAGVLETSDGSLRISPFRPTDELGLAPGAVPLTGDLAARWGWLQPSQEWRNLAVSPRFDVTGPLAARMWEATGGGPVDGVLVLDVAALRAVLSAVGPVEVEGQRVDDKTVEDLVLHGQYVQHAGDPDQSARRERLGSVAHAVVVGLEERPWSASLLGRALAKAAGGRHVLAWSSHQHEQDGWIATRIDGALGPDSLLVGVLNRGGNKLDRFLTVDASLQVRRAHGRADGVLRVRLRNDVPAGEPPYVTGPAPGSGVGEGVYLGIVSVSLPGDARNGRIDGEAALAVAGADGPTRVVGAVFTLSPGAQREMVVRFELPSRRRALRIEPSARIPPMSWAAGGHTWRDSRARSLSW